MIYGIGNDIISVERIKQSIINYGDRFKTKVFTPEEVAYCDLFGEKKYVHYAARFAVKESFSKAVGTGLAKGFKMNEIGVINEKSGKPNLYLSGELLEKYGFLKLHVTISHSDEYAIANVVIEQLP